MMARTLLLSGAAALALAGCRTEDTLCEPCTLGGCEGGQICEPSVEGETVCILETADVTSCGLTPVPSGGPDGGTDDDAGTRRDAGATRDAGPAPDAGATPDAGNPSPCGTGPAGVQWLRSRTSTLCFTQSEATLGQFQACIDQGPCSESQINPYLAGLDECIYERGATFDEVAVNCVSYAGAEDFCAWLGGRIPTRVEWQTEASQGGATAYPWGDEEPACTRAIMQDMTGAGCGPGRPRTVCSRPDGHTPTGLCDLGGNVWEWTSERVAPDTQMTRGGSWRSVDPLDLRFNAEYAVPAGGKYDDVGIRCVKPSP